MYEKDYLKRVIRQATNLVGTKIAEILGLIEKKEYVDAIEQLNGAFMTFYGMDTAMLKLLSADAVVDMLTGENEKPDAARLLVLAELLKMEGDAYLGKENTTDASRSFLAALDLYLVIAEKTGITESRPGEQHVDLLAAYLKKDGLSVSIRLRLIDYYQSDCQYGKAEDQLHGIIDLGAVSDEILRAGIMFYESLLKLEDAELEQGEIFREEVLEGLEELREYKK